MKTLNNLLLVATLLVISVSAQAQMDRDALSPLKDIVHLDDVIISGSECVGFDCVNGESFGFDTQRYKENNLRVHFQDTSTSASFPSTDWRIKINDTSNGGGNYFAIEDATAARTPFRVEGGAPNHSLYVEDGGRIGLGTSTPVVELHIADGDTPTMRLEQDGTSGFTPQTWDVAGNETNFFIRDASNGSTLPFRIEPGSASNMLYLDGTDDRVGINTTSPQAKFDVRGDMQVIGAGNTDATFGLKVANSDSDVGLYVRDDGKVGIGTNTPSSLLQVEGSDVNASIAVNITNSSPSFSGLRLRRNGVTTGGVFSNSINDVVFQAGGAVTVGSFKANGDFVVDGNVIASSDKRLKSNVNPYNTGLEAIMSLNPIQYNYNGTGGVNYKDKKIGLYAQELQEVAPDMVTLLNKESVDEDGNVKSQGSYLGIHENEIKYLLINAVKEQQAQLEAKDAQLEDLEAKVDKLESALTSLIDKLDVGNDISGKIDHEEDLVLSLSELPFVKQNVPNPYTSETSIEYFIPDNASNSEIVFYDNQGKLLKKHILSSKGFGKLNLKTQDLPAGTYVYSLIIDGKMISSKKMSVQ